jgi:hypothetical protein
LTKVPSWVNWSTGGQLVEIFDFDQVPRWVNWSRFLILTKVPSWVNWSTGGQLVESRGGPPGSTGRQGVNWSRAEGLLLGSTGRHGVNWSRFLILTKSLAGSTGRHGVNWSRFLILTKSLAGSTGPGQILFGGGAANILDGNILDGAPYGRPPNSDRVPPRSLSLPFTGGPTPLPPQAPWPEGAPASEPLLSSRPSCKT